MKQNMAIMGSTGSIGKNLINILKKNRDKFEIKLLTANKDYINLLQQAKLLKVKNIIITDKKSFYNLKKKNKNSKIKIFNNFDNLDKIFKKRIDYVMSAITGVEGLHPTIKIIKHTKNLESIQLFFNIIKTQEITVFV